MGLVEAILEEARPARSLEQRSEWGTSLIPGPTAAASVGSFSSPLPRRNEDALRKVAIWASCDLIASLISTLPLDTYRKVGEDRSKQIPNGPLVEDPGGDKNGVEDWLYQYLMSMLLAGNVVGKVAAYDPLAYPTVIALYHPDEVHGWRDHQSGAPRWRVQGREVPASEVWHRRAYPMPGCLMGLSPIEQHAATIGVAVAAERFGLQFFTDGAHPSSLLVHTEDDRPDQRVINEVKASWMAAVYGTRAPVVMGKGWEHKAISITPNESQFLETQKFTAAECCRIYGPNVAEVLGYETGGSMTYANVVDRNNALLTLNLQKWLVRIERMFTRMLPRPQYVRFNTGALLRSTTLDRYRAHALALANRWKVVNEVRDDEDMPPVEWGNKPNDPRATPAPSNNPEGKP